MTAIVTDQHRQKMASIYIRQSTLAQVRHHQQSTERQYALKDKALIMGWPEARIQILDADLGVSGAHATERHDFKKLIAEVSLSNVGAVLALEASRLARSNADWHRLIELCSLTNTLIIDEDGCYDPSDFNDGLLLGLKGTMSQAELHFIRARLQGGKLNKARKGELRFPLPVGYVYDESNRIIKDPDAEVRGAIELVFATFNHLGSAYAVVQHFAGENLRFPKRSYGGVWNGKIQWGRLTDSRVLGILKNPSYAGVYAFGRYRCVKEILSDGQIRSRIQHMPRENWLVEIQEHHDSYISFDRHLRNLDSIEQNHTNPKEAALSGPAREGLALLQGLLVCSQCGRRLTCRYKGNGGIYPLYECNWRKREGLSTSSCMTVQCQYLDRTVERRVLNVLSADQIQLALEAFELMQQRDNRISGQWKMRLDRAEYEAQLAQKRYDEVDPENRLVASSLEKRWNDALIELEEVKRQIAKVESDHVVVTLEQREQILALARDLPQLWASETTLPKDKKRILRILIEDITVEKPTRRLALLHIRWRGGACEDLTVELPKPSADRWRYKADIVDEVRRLAETYTDEEIARIFNDRGLRAAKGGEFTRSGISWIRCKHKISPVQKKKPNELTVKEVADRFGVSQHVVYYWIERAILGARRLNRGSPYWISLSTDKEKELEKWVRESSRLHS